MKVGAGDVVRVGLPLLVGRACAPLVARFVSLPKALRYARVAAPAVDVDVAVEVVRGIEAVLRMFPRGGGTCLTRALARVFAMRRAGLPVRFVLGVRKNHEGVPDGHSWLELDGQPFMEPRVENLQAFHIIYVDDAGQGAR